MAIAIDSTSPAAKTQTTTAANTSASFTPPAGALIVGIFVTGNSSSGVQSGTVSDSLSGSWTTDKTANTSGDGMVLIARRTTATTNTAMTVTWTPSGTTGKGSQQKVFVLTGADPTQPGATASGTSGTTGAVSVTPQKAGSIVVGCVCYNVTGTALTINSISLNDLATNDGTNGETYGSFHAYNESTSSQSFGYTNTGLSAQVQIAAVEYLPLTTGSIVTQTIAFDDATSTNSHVKSSITANTGNLFILAVADAGTGNGSVNGISDSASNSWTKIVGSSAAFVDGCSIWATTAGSTSAITSYTISLDASGPIQSQFYEIINGGALDGSHAGTPASSTSPTSGANTPVGTSDIAIGIIACAPTSAITFSANTFTAGAGLEAARAAKTGTIQSVTAIVGLSSAAAQTYSATLSTGSFWSACIAVWKVQAVQPLQIMFNNYEFFDVGNGMSTTEKLR